MLALVFLEVADSRLRAYPDITLCAACGAADLAVLIFMGAIFATYRHGCHTGHTPRSPVRLDRGRPRHGAAGSEFHHRAPEIPRGFACPELCRARHLWSAAWLGNPQGPPQELRDISIADLLFQFRVLHDLQLGSDKQSDGFT
jgi:hypothetical protein